MPREFTITLDDQIYAGLYAKAGRGHISRFIETVARPHVIREDLIYEELRNALIGRKFLWSSLKKSHS